MRGFVPPSSVLRAVGLKKGGYGRQYDFAQNNYGERGKNKILTLNPEGCKLIGCCCFFKLLAVRFRLPEKKHAAGTSVILKGKLFEFVSLLD